MHIAFVDADYITSVEIDGAAALEGTLAVGDRLVAVSGVSIDAVNTLDRLLEDAMGSHCLVSAVRQPRVSPSPATRDDHSGQGCPCSPPNNEWPALGIASGSKRLKVPRPTLPYHVTDARGTWRCPGVHTARRAAVRLPS